LSPQLCLQPPLSVNNSWFGAGSQGPLQCSSGCSFCVFQENCDRESCNTVGLSGKLPAETLQLLCDLAQQQRVCTASEAMWLSEWLTRITTTNIAYEAVRGCTVLPMNLPYCSAENIAAPSEHPKYSVFSDGSSGSWLGASRSALLEVRLIGADSLMAADTDLLSRAFARGQKTSDPYAVINIKYPDSSSSSCSGSASVQQYPAYRSPVCSQTLNPRWGNKGSLGNTMQLFDIRELPAPQNRQ
jgi:hypothetical protein